MRYRWREQHWDAKRLVLLLVVVLAACGSGQPAAAPGGGATQRVSLVFPGPGALIFLPFEVAKAEGFFRAQGLDVEFTYSKGGPPAVTALTSGSVDFAGATIDLALNSYKQGKTITMVAGLTRLPAFAVVTAPARADTLTSLRDLRGKTVGLANIGAGDQLILRYLLKKQGVDPDTVEYAAVGPDEAKMNALSAGRIDAAIVQEPALSMLIARGSRVLANLYDPGQAREALGGGYQFTGLLTRPETIQARSDLVQRMVNAVVAADRFIAVTPGTRLVAQLPDGAVSGGDRALLARILDQYKGAIFTPAGRIVPADVDAVARVQRESGAFAGTLPDMTSFYTNRFVEAAPK